MIQSFDASTQNSSSKIQNLETEGSIMLNFKGEVLINNSKFKNLKTSRLFFIA